MYSRIWAVVLVPARCRVSPTNSESIAGAVDASVTEHLYPLAQPTATTADMDV